MLPQMFLHVDRHSPEPKLLQHVQALCLWLEPPVHNHFFVQIKKPQEYFTYPK